MKKIMRKLVLSSFALGLAAVTLTTTTFAWYTSNTEVTANNIVGESSTSGSNLLMISEDNSTWSTSVTVTEKTTSNTLNGTNGLTNMQPVEYTYGTDNPTFKLWGNSVVSNESGLENVLQFKLYFKLASSVANQHLYLTKLNLVNNTADSNSNVDGVQLPAKDVLLKGKDEIAANYANSTYSVDILRTLMIAARIKTVTTETKIANILMDPEGAATRTTDSLGTSGFNAHAYYNLVMGKTIPTGKTEVEADKIPGFGTDALIIEKDSNGKVTQNNTNIDLGVLPCADNVDNASHHIEITFYVFINGWDLACFDAVQGQKFAVNMEFSTEPNVALPSNNENVQD